MYSSMWRDWKVLLWLRSLLPSSYSNWTVATLRSSLSSCKTSSHSFREGSHWWVSKQNCEHTYWVTLWNVTYVLEVSSLLKHTLLQPLYNIILNSVIYCIYCYILVFCNRGAGVCFFEFQLWQRHFSNLLFGRVDILGTSKPRRFWYGSIRNKWLNKQGVIILSTQTMPFIR